MLHFGAPRAGFWRVQGPFFRDLGPLGEKNAGTDFELEAKAAQFQLGARVARSSYFYVEVRPRSSTSKSGRDLLKRVGGGGLPPRGGSIRRPPLGVRSVLDRNQRSQSSYWKLMNPSLFLSPGAQGPPPALRQEVEI